MDPESLAKQEFLKRFEPDGEDFIFRPNARAPGVRVTPAERDRLVAERKKRSRVQVWIIAAAMGITLALYLVVENYFPLSKPFETPAIVCIVVVVAFFVTRRGARLERRAQEQFLKDRPIVAPARTKEEAQRAHFRQLKWSEIGTLAIVFGGVVFRIFARNHLSFWEYRIWLFCGAILVLFFFALIAYRKWRWGRDE